MGYVKDLRAIIGSKRLILNGCNVFIQNPQGQILMQLRKYPYEKWGLPGGMMELGESTEETVRREVSEETGLKLGNLLLFGIYSGKDYLCVSRNGDEFYKVTTVYTTSEYYGEVSVGDDESTKFEWMDINELPENILENHKEIVSDYIRTIQGASQIK